MSARLKGCKRFRRRKKEERKEKRKRKKKTETATANRKPKFCEGANGKTHDANATPLCVFDVEDASVNGRVSDFSRNANDLRSSPDCRMEEFPVFRGKSDRDNSPSRNRERVDRVDPSSRVSDGA